MSNGEELLIKISYSKNYNNYSFQEKIRKHLKHDIVYLILYCSRFGIYIGIKKPEIRLNN